MFGKGKKRPGRSRHRCRVCGEKRTLSMGLGVCKDCITTDWEMVRPHVEEAHARAREGFGLPARPPSADDGARCGLCANRCSIPEGGRGYCGMRENRGGRLHHLVGPERGIVEWYHDPLPTNCVASEVCPGGTGIGYPRYSNSPEGAEHGHRNLAVFYGGCSFDCLYCQNWNYRRLTRKLGPLRSARELADAVDERTSCICFFGGDPTPQMPHAIRASNLALESKRGEAVLRICWETNGSMCRGALKRALELSLASGGCIKFDLKAHDPHLHRALCGVGNGDTLANFRWAASRTGERPEVPLVTASTLLIPGYVDAGEVEHIASIIAECDRGIPYRLLAFHDDFVMDDLGTTSSREAERARVAALEAGLENVGIGNVHLLW